MSAERDFDKPRPAGRVCIRWATESGTEIDFDEIRLDDALCQAVRKWFVSNHSPDRMAMIVVVERDGEVMSNAEAEDAVKREFEIKRAARGE